MVHRNKDKVLAAEKVVDKVDKMVEGRKLMLRRAIHQQFQLEREHQKRKKRESPTGPIGAERTGIGW